MNCDVYASSFILLSIPDGEEFNLLHIEINFRNGESFSGLEVLVFRGGGGEVEVDGFDDGVIVGLSSGFLEVVVVVAVVALILKVNEL